ncbi:MAG TPA: AAA family ATPase, partial [Thermoplasmata archaeon]|nr:AAA family ATPase [Thermoplasmata archaeon]
MHAPFPETLSTEWVPPILFGRDAESEYLDRLLARPVDAGVPHAAVTGPKGSGSSVLARAAAGRWVRSSASSERGRVVAVPVRWCHGTVGVASALLRAFDEGFGGRGFSVAEIMAGFLRRLLRDGRRVAILLDDAGSAGPELRPILRALL